MQKKLVQSSLAMAAAAALGLGGAFVAGPAAAADAPKTLEVQNETQMQEALDQYLADKDGKLPEEIGRFGFEGNTLFIGATEKTDAVEALEKKYDNVEVKIGPEYESYEAQGKKDLVGGAGYITKAPHAAPGTAALCSTGFAGWDSSGKQVVITAGHCAEELDKAGNSQGPAPLWDMELPSSAEAAGSEQPALAGVGAPGDWGTTQFGYASEEDTPPAENEADAIDIASINVADGFTTKAEVATWKDPSKDDLSLDTVPVSKIGNPVRGEAITKSGRTTGVTHGTVATAEGELPWANVSGHLVHGMKVLPDGDMFSDHGDSGGAVYQGDTAVGVISGGNDSYSWVSDLKYSLDQAGIDFQLTKPDDGDDGNDGDKNAGSQADGSDGNDGSSKADGDDANASSKADGDDANASSKADGNDDKADSDADGNAKPAAPDFNKTTVYESETITGSAEPNAEVQLSWNSADANAGSSQVDSQAVPAKGSTTVKTDAKGNFSFEAPAEAGVYDYTAVTHANGQSSAPAEFTVTVKEKKTEAPAERKLTVDPTEITATDFVNDEKAVQITAEGFDEGEEVTLKVVAGPENVEGITLKRTANADGVAGFTIFGENGDTPEVYLGKYDLQATGANDTADESALKGSFEVVADDNGNGGGNDGDDDGNGDGGSDLPRTGAELTGLAAGAGLLLVGGAAVVLTMRRKKNN